MRVELNCYDKALKLSDHILSVCKPKEKNVNNKHIPKRHIGLGRMMTEIAVEIGAYILEANEIYVGSNLDVDMRKANYKERIKLQQEAKRKTYRIEHIFRTLHFDHPFAESTAHYMMNLIMELRELLTGWREADIKELKKLK